MESGRDHGQSSGDVDALCTMCGDTGIRDALMLCRKCGFRHQHTYCSRFYPNINLENWSCEWCIHEEQKEASRRSKMFEFLLEIAQSLPESPSAGNARKPNCLREDSTAEKRRLATSDMVFGSEMKENKRTAVRKNPRCIEKNRTLDRWRSLARNRLGCRRYKLLADVLC